MPAYTFASAPVLVETTGEFAIGATGIFRATEGGDPVQVYDLNDSPLPSVLVGPKGAHQAFKADIPDGVLDFESVLLPASSLEQQRAGLSALLISQNALKSAGEAKNLATEARLAALNAAKFMVHGSNAAADRPTTNNPVIWFGMVLPVNADENLDVWVPINPVDAGGDVQTLEGRLPGEIVNPASPIGAAVRTAILSFGAKVNAVGGNSRIHKPSPIAPTADLQQFDLHPLTTVTGARWRYWTGSQWVDLTGVGGVSPGTQTALTASATAGATAATVTYEVVSGADGVTVTGVRVTLGATVRNLTALAGSSQFTGLQANTTYNWSAQMMNGTTPVGTAVSGSVIPLASGGGGGTGTTTTLTFTGTDYNGATKVIPRVILGTDSLNVTGVRLTRKASLTGKGDTAGTLEWTEIVPGNADKLFDKLINGETYPITAQLMVDGVDHGPVLTYNAKPLSSLALPDGGTAPGGGGTTPPPPVGTRFSGSSFPSAVDGSFGTWRGRTVEIVGTWPDNAEAVEGMWSLANPDDLGNWNRAIDVAVGGIFPEAGENWGAAAGGAYNARFRRNLTYLRQLRNPATKQQTFIRFAHEMNGNWYEWSVHPENIANFKATWRHYYNIMKEVFPEAKLVFSPNREAAGNGSRTQDLYPGNDVVDVIAPDYYFHFPGVASQAEWDAQYLELDGNGGPKGIGAWINFAVERGKPMGLPEWGVSADHGTDSGRALAMTNMLNLIKSRSGNGPGQFWYEVYFNATADFGYNGAFGIYPNPRGENVQAAAAYRNHFLNG